MKLYVGNLPHDVTDAQLGELATAFGKTDSAVVVRDRTSGESKGFGFIEFGNDDEAKAAIAGLDGKEVNGKAIKVNEARPKGSAPGR